MRKEIKMHKLIKEWLDAESEEEKARQKTRDARERADKTPLPKKLRAAEPKDIVEGAILWYPEHGQKADDEYDAIAYWSYVSEVYSPADPCKAYCADDGCRYGLEGAFVEA